MPERGFHRDVGQLVGRVSEMAALSRRSVHEGVDAFAALDADAARRVVALNQEINRLDVDIEARAMDLIALNQPMAKDLRALAATLKVITYLDRIGRYGYDVAKATLVLEGHGHVERLVGVRGAGGDVSLLVMRDKALALLDAAVDAFRTRDAALARTVQPGDDAVDALYARLFTACVASMREDARTVPACAQYILVARHLERVGDNAGKIAEKALYMTTGERRLGEP